jgi:hypothetical protein
MNRPSKSIFQRHKERAKKMYGLRTEFTIGEFEEWLKQHANDVCSCGSAANSIDHIRPLARGGRHSLSNLQKLCRSCNSRKGHWLEGEERIYPWQKPGYQRSLMLRKPMAPKEKPAPVGYIPALTSEITLKLLPGGLVIYEYPDML